MRPIHQSEFITHIALDSREDVPSQSLFVALMGERFDAHRFIADMYAKGVRAFVVQKGHERLTDTYLDAHFLEVENTLFALGEIARLYREKFTLPVIGITGSCGKTTTKDLCAHFLSTTFTTLRTEGNLNNEIGVPKMLLRLNDEHECAVLEMGMNHSGEIARIASYARPEVAIVTNVGEVHIEFFDFVEAIAKAKSEIFSGLVGKKIALINEDGEYTDLLKREARQAGALEIHMFSLSDVSIRDENRFIYEGIEFIHNLKGSFNVMNILAALKVSQIYGVPLAECARVLPTFSHDKNRMEEIVIGKGLIVNDTYNSNPVALRNMLDYLSRINVPRRIAVVGDMLELGVHAERLHHDVAQHIATLPLDVVYTFGQQAAIISETLADVMSVIHFTDKTALAEALYAELSNECAILLKASRGIALDEVVRALKEKAGLL